MKWLLSSILFLWVSGCFIKRPEDPSPQSLSIPTKIDSTLSVPIILPNGGLVDFGKEASISTLDKEAVIEFSLDKGITWQVGNKFPVFKGYAVLARTRKGSIASAVSQVQFQLRYNRVVILGNSITYSGANPAIGWVNNCGMAASSPDSDYVAIISRHLRELNPNVLIKIGDIVSFERNYWQYNYGILKEQYIDFKPDLVILRMGENVDPMMLYQYDFRGSYRKLMDAFVQNDVKARIVCSTSFWPSDVKFFIGKAVESYNNERVPLTAEYADIEPLFKDTSNISIDLFSNSEVAKHPSNKGMKAIAEILWKWSTN